MGVKATTMPRRPKHDPANARFTVRYVGPPTDPEVRHLQLWSIRQLLANAVRSVSQKQGAVA
jgi:hypothetical protein